MIAEKAEEDKVEPLAALAWPVLEALDEAVNVGVVRSVGVETVAGDSKSDKIWEVGRAVAEQVSVMVEEVRREVVPCLNISVCGATGGPMCLLGLLEYTEIILASMCEHS